MFMLVNFDLRVYDVKSFNTNDGKTVVVVKTTNNRKQSGPAGEFETNYYDVACFGKLAEATMIKSWEKGDRFIGSGSLWSEEYQAKDGTKRNTLKISARTGDFFTKRTSDINKRVVDKAPEFDVTDMPF